MDNEEFEQIPWSQLLPQADESRQRTLYVAAGVVIAVVVGVVAARSFGGPEPTVVALSEPPPAATVVPATDVPPTDLPPAETIIEAPVATPLTEADLMAVLPEEQTRAAASAAEWFVTDYFTVDGSSTARDRIGPSVPTFARDLLPHDPNAGRLSYVEWARTVRVEPSGAGAYDIEVQFGSVASPGEGPIARLPVRTVAITVHFLEEGAPRIAGLPRFVDTLAPTAASLTIEPAPGSVMATAVERAARFGEDPEAVGAYRSGGGWHVVVVVADPASGIRWPLAVAVDG